MGLDASDHHGVAAVLVGRQVVVRYLDGQVFRIVVEIQQVSHAVSSGQNVTPADQRPTAKHEALREVIRDLVEAFQK